MKKLMLLTMLFGLFLITTGTASAQGMATPCKTAEPGKGQVFLYSDANFGGACYDLAKVGYQYSDLGRQGVPNDSISSIKVGEGARALVCADNDFKGNCQSHLGHESNMKNTMLGDNQASSVKVLDRRGTVEMIVTNRTDKTLVIFEMVGGVDSFLGTLEPNGAGKIYSDVNTSIGGKTQDGKLKSNAVQLKGSPQTIDLTTNNKGMIQATLMK